MSPRRKTPPPPAYQTALCEAAKRYAEVAKADSPAYLVADVTGALRAAARAFASGEAQAMRGKGEG